MCEFFSFAISKDGQILAIMGAEREKYIAKGLNPDSHSEIASHFGISEDECWKFELDFKNLDWEQFCKDPWTLISVDMIKNSYDGGLPLEELPIAYLQHAVNWICDHRNEIVRCKDALNFWERLRKRIFDDPNNWEKAFLIKLPVAVDFENLVGKLGLVPAQKGWGDYVIADGGIIRINMKQRGVQNICYLAIQRWIHRWARFEEGKDEPVVGEEKRIAIMPMSVPITV